MPKLPSATLAGLLILIGLNLSITEIQAAPGDHMIEVIGRTGDVEAGPDFNPIQEIRYGRFGGGSIRSRLTTLALSLSPLSLALEKPQRTASTNTSSVRLQVSLRSLGHTLPALRSMASLSP